MSNSFAKPLTPRRLLLASLGWVAVSWGSWLAVATLLTRLLPPGEWRENTLLLSWILLVQAGVWLQAVPRSWQASRVAAGSSLMLLVDAWLLLLAGTHLCMLAFFLLGLAFALGGPIQF